MFVLSNILYNPLIRTLENQKLILYKGEIADRHGKPELPEIKWSSENLPE